MRILIAEDDAVLGLLLGEILEGLGHTICAIVATEDEAVRGATETRPDLIIVDGRLRDGSGISAMRRILREGPVAHLFMSGDIILPLEGAAAVLRKPFSENDLVQAIELAVDLSVAIDAQSTAPDWRLASS